MFISLFNGFITMCNLQKCLIHAAFWLLLQAMFASNWKQTAQRLELQKRLLTINKRIIIRWNVYRDNNFHSRRQVKSVSENPCLCFKPASRRFLSICSEKMSKGFLKFYKLIIKLDSQSDRLLSQILQTCIN